MDKFTHCVKCGAEKTTALECPSCGAIYAKAERLYKEPPPKVQPCPACGKEVSVNAESCPHCGEPCAKMADDPIQSTPKKKTIYLFVAIAIFLCIFTTSIIYLLFFYKEERSAMVNNYISSCVASNDFDEAKNTIEMEYGGKNKNPILYRFWNLYIDSCKQGKCLEVTIDPDLKKLNEETAYMAAKKFTLNRLKAPATAVFEVKNQLSTTGSIGDQYSFSFTVDADNSFGAKIRTNCSAIVQNVGEYSWYLSSHNCE